MTDDQLTQAQNIYRAARDSGKDKTSAKRAVRAQLPDFHVAINTDKAYLAKWGRAVQIVERAINGGIAKPTNGNGRHPSLFPDSEPRPLPAQFTSAPAFTRWLFEAYVERARAAGKPVQPGCTYTFSPNQCVAILAALDGRELRPGGFVNEFLPNQTSLLQRAGWGFETMPKSTHEVYTVRITAVPAPPAPAPQPVAPAPAAPTSDNKLFEEFAAFMAWRNANQS